MLKKNVTLEVAVGNDAEKIRNLMISVEKDEAARWYDNDERPFIPGYDSIDMQKYHMWDNRYYKIMYNGFLAGVLLLSYTGREHARVDRFYIEPSFQNKGIGSKVITLMEEMYPMVKVWTLDTIQKSVRNHNFYEKNRYNKVGEDEEERYYCKVIETSTDITEKLYFNKDFSSQNFHQYSMDNVDFYDTNMTNSKLSNVNMQQALIQNANLSKTRITNVNMSNSVIGDSNLSKIEICHVSLADAYLHDINLGIKEEKRPLIIERCELINSTIIDSNLKNLSISNSNVEGMTIDGVLVSELLKAYKEKLKESYN